MRGLLLLLISALDAAIIRQTICKNKNEIDSASLSVNFVQVSIDGKSLEKVTKIPLRSANEITDDNRILDQPVTNVVFELLIRIEIVWNTRNTADRLCLSGLEVRKIGLLQPIQILDEVDGQIYQFGCPFTDCVKQKTKFLPPRLNFPSNGTFYSVVSVKLRNMTDENDLKSDTAVGESIDKLNRYFDNLFEDVTNFDGSRAAVFRPYSGYLLADVVLTFTDWTDNWRIDLQKPSIMDSMKTALETYENSVSIENFPQYHEMETALIALFPTLTFCGLIFPAFISFKHESGPKRCRRWLFMIFTVVETYLDVRVWQKFATTGMTLTGYDPTISNLMIFFTFMTFLVQLVKFNLAVIPHIQAYRRVKFGDDKYSVDTTRTVFKIDSFTATLYIFGRVPLSFIVHFYLVKMKVPRAIVPRELTWKLIFHVPIYLYLFWVAYQKVRRSIKATRDCRLKPSAQVGNPNWQWLLGMPYFLAPFYSIMLVAATTSYLQMDEKSQLSLKGCIVGQNPVSQNPLSFRCLRAVDYAILIFFSVFMLSGLVMFIFRIINKQMELLPALNEESYSRGNRPRAQKSKRTQPAEESSEKTQAAVVYDAAKETSSKVVTKAVKSRSGYSIKSIQSNGSEASRLLDQETERTEKESFKSF